MFYYLEIFLAIHQKPNVKMKIMKIIHLNKKKSENPTQPNTTQIQLIENLKKKTIHFLSF
jgi:hypothetical protein